MTWPFKVLFFLWPFVRELVLDDMTVTEAVKNYKIRVMFMIMIVLSFGINAFLIPRSFQIAADLAALERKHKQATDDLAQFKKKPAAPTAVVTPVDAVKPIPADTNPPPNKPTRKPAPVINNDRYDHVKNRFRQIKNRESEEN